MARFLFTTWPIETHYGPALAIAYSLAERGHAVAFYTGTPLDSVIAQAGFAFFLSGT